MGALSDSSLHAFSRYLSRAHANLTPSTHPTPLSIGLAQSSAGMRSSLTGGSSGSGGGGDGRSRRHVSFSEAEESAPGAGSAAAAAAAASEDPTADTADAPADFRRSTAPARGASSLPPRRASERAPDDLDESLFGSIAKSVGVRGSVVRRAAPPAAAAQAQMSREEQDAEFTRLFAAVGVDAGAGGAAEGDAAPPAASAAAAAAAAAATATARPRRSQPTTDIDAILSETGDALGMPAAREGGEAPSPGGPAGAPAAAAGALAAPAAPAPNLSRYTMGMGAGASESSL
jgi:hypothetical protein